MSWNSWVYCPTFQASPDIYWNFWNYCLEIPGKSFIPVKPQFPHPWSGDDNASPSTSHLLWEANEILNAKLLCEQKSFLPLWCRLQWTIKPSSVIWSSGVNLKGKIPEAPAARGGIINPCHPHLSPSSAASAERPWPALHGKPSCQENVKTFPRFTGRGQIFEASGLQFLAKEHNPHAPLLRGPGLMPTPRSLSRENDFKEMVTLHVQRLKMTTWTRMQR